MDSVPRRRGGRDRGGVVHGGARKEAEPLVAQPEKTAQARKDESRRDVEEEDHRYGGRDFLVFRVDDGGCRRDGRASADGRAHADKGGDIGREPDGLVHEKGDKKRNRDRREDDRQGLSTRFHDAVKVHAEAQENHRVLKDFLGGEPYPLPALPPLLPKTGKDHAHEDSKNGPPHDGKALAKAEGGQRYKGTDKYSSPTLFQDILHTLPPCGSKLCPILHVLSALLGKDTRPPNKPGGASPRRSALPGETFSLLLRKIYIPQTR